MQNTTTKKQPELLVDSHHGIYIAQIFCQTYKAYITNFDEVKEDFEICLLGPDSEDYWDSWDSLINNVEFTNDYGDKYTIGNLGDEGDMWAIPENYDYENEDF